MANGTNYEREIFSIYKDSSVVYSSYYDTVYLLPDKSNSRWHDNRTPARANREILDTSQRVQRSLLADGR